MVQIEKQLTMGFKTGLSIAIFLNLAGAGEVLGQAVDTGDSLKVIEID